MRTGLHSICLLLTLASACSGQSSATDSSVDIPALLKRAMQVSDESSKRTNDYDCVRIESGNMGLASKESSGEAVWLVYTVDGVAVKRKMLDGRSPVSAEAVRKADKEIDELLRKRRKPQRPTIDTSAQTFLAAGTFTFVKRGVIEGRPSIWLHYQGDPKRRTRNLNEKVATHTTGTMVLDEEDGAIRTFDTVLDSDMTMALILKMKKGTQMRMEDVRVAKGIWLTKSVTINTAGRLMLNSMNLHYDMRNTSYRFAPPRSRDEYAGAGYGSLEPELREEMVRALDQFDAEVGLPPQD